MLFSKKGGRKMLDITPSINLLRSYRTERIDYALLIGEGIDNAFDAGANRVDVRVDPEFVSFRDDGNGITRDRISSLFSLGQHGPMTTTMLGRFGIGIKSQAVNTGDTLIVDSTSLDGRVIAKVVWPELLSSGRWLIDDPRWKPTVVGAPRGTTIKISGLRPVPDVKVDEIYLKLADWFYPAITSGKTITLNGQMVDVLPDPELTDAINLTLELSNGKSAVLTAGILNEPSKQSGVHLAFRHRVIKHGTRIGTDGYSTGRRLFARVLLIGLWRFAKFKNDLADQAEEDELADAIFAVIEPILKKVSEATFDARLDEIGKKVNALIPEEIAARPHVKKEKTEKRKEEKTANGGGSKAGKVDPDKSDPSLTGPARAKKRNDRLLITWDGDAEEDGIGRFRRGSPHHVDLSRHDPLIAELLSIKDQDLSAKLLVEQALVLYIAWKNQPEQGELFESFGKQVSKLLEVNQTKIPAAGKAKGS